MSCPRSIRSWLTAIVGGVIAASGVAAEGTELLSHAEAKKEGCTDVHRLLLLARGNDDEIADTRRRLEEDSTLEGVVAWVHTNVLGVTVAELGCTQQAEEIIQSVLAGHVDRLEHVEVDQVTFSTADAPTSDTFQVSSAQKHHEYPADAPTSDTFQVSSAETFPTAFNFELNWEYQWGLHRIGAPDAWTYVETLGLGARETVVAVLDTGVDFSHPDLSGRQYTNPGEIPGNGLDDDGNGYVDDVHGWDFRDQDADPTSIVNGHGTACAGIIAAQGGNSQGMVGVVGNHSVKIMSVRHQGPNGAGLLSDALLAIDYTLSMQVPISSNSWVILGQSDLFAQALTRAASMGHLFITAAGNFGNRSSDIAPCADNSTSVVCVAATEPNNAFAPYSNFDPVLVDIAAPGTAVWTIWPNSSYANLSGTSMATPHVAGAAALIYSRFTSLSGPAIREMMLRAATRGPWLTGLVASGFLDLYALVAHASGQFCTPAQQNAGFVAVDEQCQCPEDAQLGHLNVVTDYWWGETAWNLTSAASGRRLLVNPSVLARNAVFNQTACLVPGNYTLHFTDLWGDGMAPGNYTMEVGGVTVHRSNGSFGFGESISFTVCEYGQPQPFPHGQCSCPAGMSVNGSSCSCPEDMVKNGALCEVQESMPISVSDSAEQLGIGAIQLQSVSVTSARGPLFVACGTMISIVLAGIVWRRGGGAGQLVAGCEQSTDHASLVRILECADADAEGGSAAQIAA